MSKMYSNDWSKLKYFKSTEFKCPEQLHTDLMFKLDTMRDMAKKSFKINSDYRVGDKGFHGKGMAIDGYFVGMNLLEQFLLAIRYFNGVGVYLNWNNKGIHIDVRPLGKYEPRALWGAVAVNGKQVYVPLDNSFWSKALV